MFIIVDNDEFFKKEYGVYDHDFLIEEFLNCLEDDSDYPNWSIYKIEKVTYNEIKKLISFEETLDRRIKQLESFIETYPKNYLTTDGHSEALVKLEFFQKLKKDYDNEQEKIREKFLTTIKEWEKEDV